MKKPIWLITRKLLSSTQGPEMISPNSFRGFVFTRAIDMNLDPPFLYNPLNKNEQINVIYYSETVEFYTRFWNDISQLILWFYLCKGHRYGLIMTYIDSPIPNPAKSLGNNDKNTILFINRKVLSARKLLLKHIYLILFNQFRPYL